MRLNTFIDTVQGQRRSPELARPLDQEEWLYSNPIRHDSGAELEITGSLWNWLKEQEAEARAWEKQNTF